MRKNYFVSGAKPAPTPTPAPATAPITDLPMIGAVAGSGAHVINIAMAEMWHKYVKKPTKVNVIVRPPLATLKSFEALDSGQVSITWAPASFSFLISKGLGLYKEYGKRSFYKLFGGGEACPFVITTNPDIKTIADTKGRKMAAKGAAGLPLETIRQAYFEANGMTDDDVELLEFAASAYTDCVRMLKEGTAEVGMLLSSTLNPHVEELALSRDIYFISVTDAELKSLISKEPYWYKSFIPAGTYKGQDYDVPIASHTEGYFVRHDFDQEMAYEMVKAIYDHHEELAACHPTARYWSLADAASITRIYHPFCPGSVKYFKGKGIWTDEHEAKQQELLKEAGL